jgi:hypothetical protein
MLHHIYVSLYALSILAFFPWGATRGDIWTQPKVYVLVAIALTNLAVLLFGHQASTMPPPPPRWRVYGLLWVLFLGAGYLSVSLSPFPDRAFDGQEEMATGWTFWAIVAFTSLSNGGVLRAYPHLLRSQVQGLLIGGGLQAIACIPQLINWKIDYTATTGQVMTGYEDNILVSNISKDLQPIGFYSHRGHSSIMLAELSLLAIVARRWNWISARWFWPLISIMGAIVLLSRTRATLLAGLLGLGLMLGWRYRRLLAIGAVTIILIIGLVTINRPIEGIPIVSQITSDRVYLWKVAAYGIRQRPIWGWGFDGFGLAYPWSNSETWKPEVTDIGVFWFDYREPDGTMKRLEMPSNKAHNQILDTLLSVGIAGSIPFFSLIAIGVYGLARSPAAMFTPLACVYLAFVLLWFDCAQYGYWLWWVLSLEFWPGLQTTFGSLRLPSFHRSANPGTE